MNADIGIWCKNPATLTVRLANGTASTSKVKSRGRKLRVKTGCLTCRRRKKKCDETKPKCAGCRRNELDCQWPEASGHPSHKHSVPSESHSAEDAVPARCTADIHIGIISISSTGVASAFTKVSSLFLRHYTSETGVILAVRTSNKNPFLTHIFPLACTDDLLMHSVLALSGTHLGAKLSSPSHVVERSTFMHYGAMVEGVRENMVLVRENEISATIRLLAVLIMLCHYQIMEGSEDGRFYEHVKACSMLINKILRTDVSRENLSADQHDLLGFCLELFAYIMTSNYVSPFGTLVGEPLQLDTDILSHEHLSQYRTFGTMFAGLYGLYQFMPQIARVASKRLQEEAKGYIQPSKSLSIIYEKLEQNIASWTPGLPLFDADMQDWLEQSMTAEIIRRGLYIYLLTAMCGSVVDDFETIEVIQTYAHTMFKYMIKIMDSKYQTLFLWPALICGSCLTDERLQKQLLNSIRASYCQARHVYTACHALELLWQDPDPRAFGPYGLHRLKENGYWIPVL